MKNLFMFIIVYRSKEREASDESTRRQTQMPKEQRAAANQRQGKCESTNQRRGHTPNTNRVAAITS